MPRHPPTALINLTVILLNTVAFLQAPIQINKNLRLIYLLTLLTNL